MVIAVPAALTAFSCGSWEAFNEHLVGSVPGNEIDSSSTSFSFRSQVAPVFTLCLAHPTSCRCPMPVQPVVHVTPMLDAEAEMMLRASLSRCVCLFVSATQRVGHLHVIRLLHVSLSCVVALLAPAGISTCSGLQAWWVARPWCTSSRR
jgi:hypothetical protein